jgi:ubiquinone/menaquinone biosynthesis C-methylase UbiE
MIEIRHAEDSPDALRQAYDSFYSERTTEHHHSYYRWILRQLQPRPGTRLLDLCCGSAVLAVEARRRGVAAVGVDFAVGPMRGAAAPVVAGDALQLPFADGQFEYVINLGSLEHFEDMQHGAREMLRVLHPRGTCLVLVPNTFGMLGTIMYARFNGDIVDDGQPLQRYATRVQWQQLLERTGFEVMRVIGYEFPPPETAADWWRFARNPRGLLIPTLIWPFIPVNLASNLVFFCRRARAGAPA